MSRASASDASGNGVGSRGGSTAGRSSRRAHLVPGAPVDVNAAVAPQGAFFQPQMLQQGYVANQAARFSAGAGMEMDPEIARMPPVIEMLDADNRPRVDRNGKQAYGLLNPNRGERQRLYIEAHTRAGSKLRQLYPQLYAPWAAVLPPLGGRGGRGGRGVAGAAGARGSRSTPLRNGQPIKILNPFKLTQGADGMVTGPELSFGGSEYGRLLPTFRGNQAASQNLINFLAQVDPNLSQIVANDIMQDRIGKYVLNPETSRYIKVGSDTYNRLLLGATAQQLAQGQTMTAQQLEAAAAARGPRGSSRSRARTGLGIFVINPLTNRPVEVGGPSFNSLIENGMNPQVRQAALQAGASNEQLENALRTGGRASARGSNRARGGARRGGARASAGRVQDIPTEPQNAGGIRTAVVGGAPAGNPSAGRNNNPVGGINAQETGQAPRVSPLRQEQFQPQFSQPQQIYAQTFQGQQQFARPASAVPAGGFFNAQPQQLSPGRAAAAAPQNIEF